MPRTLERPLIAYSLEGDKGVPCLLSPVVIAQGEIIELLRDRTSANYRRLKWRASTYACLRQDLLASSLPQVIPVSAHPDENERPDDSVLPVDRQLVAKLEDLLANGAKFDPGDNMPVGWTPFRERTFAKVTPKMLALASRRKGKA